VQPLTAATGVIPSSAYADDGVVVELEGEEAEGGGFEYLHLLPNYYSP
jgi:hypothetical protein